MNNAALQFDAATHTYTLAGRVLPSVTQVLDDVLRELEGIPDSVLKPAGEFGNHVHQATDLLDRQQLDRVLLDPRLEPYVAAWTRFKTESRVIILGSEVRVHHRALGYAGMLDRLVAFPPRKLACVLDIKTSAQIPRSVGAQTAAYREAYNAAGHALDRTRYCVHLRGDGTYRLEKLTDPSDFALFQSCLNVWRFRHAH